MQRFPARMRVLSLTDLGNGAGEIPQMVEYKAA